MSWFSLSKILRFRVNFTFIISFRKPGSRLRVFFGRSRLCSLRIPPGRLGFRRVKYAIIKFVQCNLYGALASIILCGVLNFNRNNYYNINFFFIILFGYWNLYGVRSKLSYYEKSLTINLRALSIITLSIIYYLLTYILTGVTVMCL